MTLIKNSIKLLIGFFAVVSVATTQKVDALSFTDYFNLPAYACSTSTFSETLLKYASVGVFSNSNVSNWTNYNTLVSSNSAPNYRFNLDCSYAGGRAGGVSFLKPTKESNQIIIGLYNYNGGYDNVVLPKSGYSHTMKNGETVLFDNIYLGHGFFVLYTSDYSHTLQFFNDYYLEDYILFTDPLESSLTNSSIDNFFLISFPKKKAWSMKLLEMHIDPIFKGKLDNYSISQFPFTSSYTLTESSSNSPFPAFSSYMSASISNWSNLNGERFKNDVGFIYTKDLNFVAPDFGGETNNNNQGLSNFNIALVNDYNDCVNKGENLRKALQLSAMCKLQGEDTWENIIINTGLNYIGSNSYCIDLDQFITTAYNIYSGNWNNGIINENINLQDNSAPFNDLIFSRYYNSVFIDSNNNITGLPVGNSWCSAYTVSNFYNNEKSTIEKISDSLTDFFGSGVAGIYNDTIGSHSTFSGLVSSISAGTSGFFNTYLFEPYQQQFNSGFDAFHSQLGINSCNDINSSFANMPFGNTALYIISAIFIFILLMFL